MHVAVLGPTGFGGSHVCAELLAKGHQVTGISRSPEKLGTHDRYKPVPVDLQEASIAQLVEAFKSIEVIVNAYNPPAGPNLYSTTTESFLETVRKIILAVKASTPSPYLVAIGGTGSLGLGPAHPYQTVADSRELWVAYRRAVADSEAATAHMEARIGAGNPLAFRDAELPRRPHRPCYEGQPRTFRWSLSSRPSARYRPGPPRTGAYEVVRDLDPPWPRQPSATRDATSDNAYDGRLLGISAADLALAIADEVETQGKVGWHWTAVADLAEEDAPMMPAFATIGFGELCQGQLG
ncbi:hypothetical protein LTR36_007060 [Oleoguttula mirabilis]|uniref:NAD-dependent epimerase/dehydratase domain-containing protein n=1 Tax=Oleoguttula mirabilis TaxID=1507867 RepID=A0AAV9JAP9_9PEZI|nr:hypothetical protein LTR36_007060 [Oleoguttula mirabilis]